MNLGLLTDEELYELSKLWSYHGELISRARNKMQEHPELFVGLNGMMMENNIFYSEITIERDKRYPFINPVRRANLVRNVKTMGDVLWMRR